MESTRQSKIGRLLQKELSEVLQQQSRQMHGVLITITDVKVSPDLSIARAYVSVFPSEKGKEIVAALKEHAKTIRYEVGTRVRHQLRIIPEFSFFLDETLDYLEKIDQLLSSDKGSQP